MKFRRSIFTLGLAAVVVLAGVAFAQMETGRVRMDGRPHDEAPTPEGTARPHGGYFSPGWLQRELGLSEDQAQKLRALRTEYEKEMIRKHADVQVARLELRDLLVQKDAGLPQVEKKVQELSALRGEMMLLRIRNMMKAKEFLSDEQFAKFKRIVLARASHRFGKEGWMSRRPYPGGMMGY